MNEVLRQAINGAAADFDLPANVLRAMVQVESSGNMRARRYEKSYRWLWGKVTGNTERVGQMTSWGPLQVMGAVARELGLNGPFEQLLGPMGVHYGAMHLAQLKRRFFDKHGWEGVIAAYNAGSPRKKANGQWANQEYVRRVHAEMLNERLRHG